MSSFQILDTGTWYSTKYQIPGTIFTIRHAMTNSSSCCSNNSSVAAHSSGSSTPSVLPFVHSVHLPISPPGHRFV